MPGAAFFRAPRPAGADSRPGTARRSRDLPWAAEETGVSHPPTPPSAASALDPRRVARLEALRRLAMGGAHALNNAFTTLVGEVTFLQEDRKDDPGVAEACETMLAELARCTRITRALLARRHPSQAGGTDVDLVRLVRELGAILQETLGSQHLLQVKTPDDLVPVVGLAGELETLVLGLVHYAADAVGGPTSLRLEVEGDRGDGRARLSLEVRAPGLPVGVEEVFLAPDRAADPVVAAGLEAVAELVAELGGSRHAARTAPDAWTARISLPLAC